MAQSDKSAANSTWGLDIPPPEMPALGPVEWVRVLRRAIPLGLVVFGGLALLLLVRLIERPLCGVNRPVTPYITLTVCRIALWCIGLRHVVEGRPAPKVAATVANHASWLDIFVLNATQRIYFVSKAEVAGWPGIGWLARATGTVFIRRDRAEAAAHTKQLEDRLRAGHRLLFFPEGTSTDGRRVLKFRTTLFQSFQTGHAEDLIQPVTLIYTAPPGQDARFYGWWGDIDFGPHLLMVLAAPRQGSVQTVFHNPVRVGDHPNRKALAAACEAPIRQALIDRIG